MKKEHIEKYNYLYKGFAFLWHNCSSCGKDVRFEKMWRALIGPFHGGQGNWDYLCMICCNNEKDAHSYYLNNKYRPPRPPMPTPPPIRILKEGNI